MISTIRKVIHHPIVKGFLFVLILSISGVFVFVFKFFEADSRRYAATVNGSKISYRAFVVKRHEEEQRLREMRAQYGQLMDMLLKMRGMSSDPSQIAIEQLIREELLDQLADKLNVHVHDDFVDEMLSQPSFLMRELSGYISPYVFDEHGLNRRRLQAHLAQMGLSLDDFDRKVQEMLKRSLAVNLMIGASYVPKSMVRSRYIQAHAAHQFSILHFDFGAYLEQAKKQAVNKTQLKSYYDAQNALNKRYWEPEKRSGVVWEFDADRHGTTVDEDQINAYYNDNKLRKYVQEPVKLKMRRILFAVTNPTQEALVMEQAQAVRGELVADPSLFAKKAQELSADKESAKNGGLLPLFSRGTYDPSFEKPAFLLKNDGDLSSIIRTQDGIEILQRVQRVSAVVKSFASVKGEIKNLLTVRAFKNKFIKDVKRFLNSDEKSKTEQASLFEKARTKKKHRLVA